MFGNLGILSGCLRAGVLPKRGWAWSWGTHQDRLARFRWLVRFKPRFQAYARSTGGSKLLCQVRQRRRLRALATGFSQTDLGFNALGDLGKSLVPPLLADQAYAGRTTYALAPKSVLRVSWLTNRLTRSLRKLGSARSQRGRLSRGGRPNLSPSSAKK